MAYIMKHAADPRQEILSSVGDLSEIEIFHNQLLVAIYIRPEMTAGGVIISGKTRDEDKWQGKVGLVLKKGNSAFVDDSKQWFDGINVDVGDWVVFRPSDGWGITINNLKDNSDILCRLLDDTVIRGRIENPDKVW
jgi:co-chaperonin GroES (HSP10)